jgi:hypothetical protein
VEDLRLLLTGSRNRRRTQTTTGERRGLRRLLTGSSNRPGLDRSQPLSIPPRGGERPRYHTSSPRSEAPAGYVNSGQHARRGLGIPPSLAHAGGQPPGAAVRWARAGGPKPRQPPGPAGKFCGVCGRLADSYCPDDAIRGQTVASIRLTALTRPRIASSWGAQAVRCGGLTTRPPRPRTAPWGTRWGQMDGHPAPPAFSRAARLAGSHLGASPTLVTDVPPLSYRMGSLGSPLRRPARGQG